MTQKSSGDHAEDLGADIESLIVSGIRLSAGLTLYGIGQLQKIIDAAVSDKGLPLAVEKIGSTLSELSGALESHMDETKKEALRSVSRVSAKALEKAVDAFSPSAAADAGGRLIGLRDGTAANTVSVPTPLAVDVLTGTPSH